MDVDTYTRNMIFLAKKENYYRVHKLLVVPHQNLNSLADRLWLATNRDNHYQTANLQYLVEEHNKKQKKQKASIDMKELYKGDHLDALIDIFENNSCDNVMRLILHQRPDINAQNSTGNTLLHCAKHKHQYNSLLSQLKIDVNIQNEKGETPLHFAIKNPRWIPYTGPLHIGGAGIDEWGQAEALLKDVRTNVLLRTNKGKTVLHYAAQYASNRKKGFEYLRTDVTGFYILKLLVEKLDKNDVLVVDSSGKTALYLAVKHGHTDAVEFLFPLFPDEMKFSINKNGKTLLHIATEYKYNNSKIIKYLIAQFPDQKKYVRDHQGKTFLDYAYENDKLQWLTEKDKKDMVSEKDKEYVISEEDNNIVVSYSFRDYLVAFILGHKKVLILGSLASLAAYFYMRR
jgi:ankyrin repeat protein